MKKNLRLSLLLLTVVSLSSCSSWQRLGTLTMISTRNVDSKTEYVELARYVDSESKEAKNALKRTTSETGKKLDLAVDRCVATVPGGEFLKNVQIYLNGSNVRVIGDVWGRGTGYSLSADQQKVQKEKAERDSLEKEKQLKSDLRKKELEEKKQQQLEEKQKLADSFSIGDKVTWNNTGKYLTGEIIGKDSDSAAIKYLDKYGKEQIKKVRYQSLTKIAK
jgi:hypothetical protein